MRTYTVDRSQDGTRQSKVYNRDKTRLERYCTASFTTMQHRRVQVYYRNRQREKQKKKEEEAGEEEAAAVIFGSVRRRNRRKVGVMVGSSNMRERGGGETEREREREKEREREREREKERENKKKKKKYSWITAYTGAYGSVIFDKVDVCCFRSGQILVYQRSGRRFVRRQMA